MNKNIQSEAHTQIDESRQGEALLLDDNAGSNTGKKLFLESYGCAMNFADSEVVASILKDEGYTTTKNFEDADVIFVNTCAIRENAEQRVRTRLYDYNKVKRRNPDLIIGVLGCMAERLKGKLLEEEKLVDLVVGPDAYRHLPLLLKSAEDGQRAINVLLSKEETYADDIINRIKEKYDKRDDKDYAINNSTYKIDGRINELRQKLKINDSNAG
jgi:tRNA-2-methylthio-N6-dimethylallyladenosine synthase